MALHDFRCPEGHVTERIVLGDVREAICQRCDLTATRLVTQRVAIIGPTTDTRGMFRRYQEASAEIAHESDRYEASTGLAAPPSSAWADAKAHAVAMTAAGEAPLLREGI